MISQKHDDDSLESIMRAALAERGPAPKTGSDDADPLAGLFEPPTGPDQYVIDVPRGIARDGELEQKARQWFHEARLPQNLVAGIVREYCRCLGTEPKGRSEAHQIQAELAREWGEDCGRKIDLARRLIAQCSGADELVSILGESGLGNNAWLIRSLAAFGELPPPAQRIVTEAGR